MTPRSLLAATLLLLFTACKHPMQKALDSGDGTAACRVYWAGTQEDREQIEESTREALGDWIARGVDLRVRAEHVPLESLLEGVEGAERVKLAVPASFYRVTWSVAKLPTGSRIELEPLGVRAGLDVQETPPAAAADPRTAKALEQALGDAPELRLETIPAEVLPAEFVRQEFQPDGRPGKLVYREGADPMKVAMGVLTGGVTWLLEGGTAREPEFVPETDPKVVAAYRRDQAKKKASFEKEEARRRQEFEEKQRAEAADRKAKIEAVTARNRELLTAHEKLLAARKQLSERGAKAFAAATCEVGAEGRVALAQGQACTYASWGEPGIRVSDTERWDATVRARVHLSADSNPCTWEMIGFFQLDKHPEGPGRPMTNTLNAIFGAGERSVPLSGFVR